MSKYRRRAPSTPVTPFSSVSIKLLARSHTAIPDFNKSFYTHQTTCNNEISRVIPKYDAYTGWRLFWNARWIFNSVLFQLSDKPCTQFLSLVSCPGIWRDVWIHVTTWSTPFYKNCICLVIFNALNQKAILLTIYRFILLWYILIFFIRSVSRKKMLE